MVKIGNGNSNSFWEHHYNGERLPANVESEIRENFITAKYVTRSWVPMTTVETKDRLSNLLCENVTSDNLMKSIELIALGANVRAIGGGGGGGVAFRGGTGYVCSLPLAGWRGNVGVAI